MSVNRESSLQSLQERRPSVDSMCGEPWVWVSEGERHTHLVVVQLLHLLVPSRCTFYLLGHFYFCFFKSDTFKIKIDIVSPVNPRGKQMLKQGDACSHCEKYTVSTRLCKCETGVRHGSVCSWTAWKPPTLFFFYQDEK